MKFDTALEKGILVKRYKRFLADVETPTGVITIHCPNTGSMKGCAEPGSTVWFSDSNNPKRKYRHTWELVKNHQGHVIGINTGRANSLIREAMENQLLPDLEFESLKAEVPYGDEKSRIDFLLLQGENKVWIEVKNTTLLDEDEGSIGQGFFPDSITSRGTKHLRELMHQVKQGDRAVLIFCVQHSGIKTVSPATHIDPLYSKTLKEAVNSGVEVIAAETELNDHGIKVIGTLPVLI